MAPENKEILEKMSEIGDQITHAQEKNTELEKKFDAVDFASIKDNTEEAAQKLEKMQEERLKVEEENKTRLLAIEKVLTSNGGNADETDKEHLKEWYGYLRKGTPMSSEAIHSRCEELSESTIVHSDDIKKASYTKDLVEGSNADGGFWVMPERSSEKVTREFETSPMRSVSSSMTTTSDEVQLVIDDNTGVSGGWVGEVETRAKTATPKIGLLSIPVHEQYAFPFISQRMLDDAGFDVVGWLQEKVDDIITREGNTASVTGDGSKKYKGFLAYPDWDSAGVYQRDALEQFDATGTAGTLDEGDDLINLQNKLLGSYQAGAIFAGTRSTFSEIMKLKDGVGRYLMNPLMLKEGTTEILLRKRFIFMADMPEIAANALSVAYGDFRKSYVFVDRFGLRVLRDPLTVKGLVGYYSTQRGGAAVKNFQGIKILKINA